VHVPNDTSVTSPALVTVQTLGVLDVYVTAKVELAVAARVKGALF
jgi:hypothetical protein